MKANPKMISVMIARSKTGRRAFTFIELMIVITIIGILSVIAIPQFRKVADNFELENFVKNIFYLSHYLQSSAISQGKIYCLNIDKNEGKIWSTYKVGDEFKQIEGKFGRIYKVPEGLIFSAGKKEIYFYPDASIDEVTVDFESKYRNKASLIIKGGIGEIKIQ